MTLNLNYEGFEKNLVRNGRSYDGIQYFFAFNNRFGASVIKHSDSIGHTIDLWELAVFRRSSAGLWHICYDTDITDDYEVLGCLTDEEVRKCLKQISELNDDGTLKCKIED